jgi:predicted metalloprotease with PDZ domain
MLQELPISRLTPKSLTARLWLPLVATILLFCDSAFAQKQDALRIDYNVAIASVEGQLFHVTTEVKNITESSIELSLPTWTPGWYTVENYYKNVLRFKFSDSKGNTLQPEMIKKQTWRIETKGLGSLRVEFDYKATVLALNQAKITNDFAFFTGTELFLEVARHRNSPITVRFELPKDWKIISALKETSDPMVFTASDYDTLVDAPTEMGRFDTTQFQVEGKPHYLVSTPAGALSKDKAVQFADMLAKVATAQSAIFGGLPYEKYVYFYFFSRPESNAGGALEHLNSHVAFAFSPNPEFMIGTASHEFFHLWNVKRIRPVEMWPYDYSRENETPLLWVSEGFTNYYGSIATFRAGLRTREQFVRSVQDGINGVENNEARLYIPPASSSVSTWVGYDTPVAFGISYYTQGQNLGALLDLSILNDTNGEAGLDDVMRALYRDFYQKGRGFTTDDMIGIINRLTKHDYRDFYRKYVFGVEVPTYDEIFGYAGYRTEKSSRPSPTIGVGIERSDEGIRITRVSAGSEAARVGLRVGDIVVSANGTNLGKDPQALIGKLGEKIGHAVTLSIKRGAQVLSSDVQVGTREDSTYKVVETPSATPKQLKIREAWLKTMK